MFALQLVTAITNFLEFLNFFLVGLTHEICKCLHLLGGAMKIVPVVLLGGDAIVLLLQSFANFDRGISLVNGGVSLLLQCVNLKGVK